VALYRSKGFTVQAILPPQQIANGVVKILITEAKLSEVNVKKAKVAKNRMSHNKKKKNLGAAITTTNSKIKMPKLPKPKVMSPKDFGKALYKFSGVEGLVTSGKAISKCKPRDSKCIAKNLGELAPDDHRPLRIPVGKPAGKPRQQHERQHESGRSDREHEGHLAPGDRLLAEADRQPAEQVVVDDREHPEGQKGPETARGRRGHRFQVSPQFMRRMAEFAGSLQMPG
jgi:hypothetical protein